MINELMMVERQKGIEAKYSRTNINKVVQKDLDETPCLIEKMFKAVELLHQWVAADHTYGTAKTPEAQQSKNRRLAQLDTEGFPSLVNSIMLVVLQLDQPEKMTSLVGRLANSMGYSNKQDGIKTIAEIIAVICEADVFDIIRGDLNQLYIKNLYRLDDRVLKFIAETKYLPPMVCRPEIVRNNYESGYLTKKDALILKAYNYHDENICLDHINRMNQIPLTLNIPLLKLYAEMPKKALDTEEKRIAYERMVNASYRVYADLAANSNRFFLTHKVDKRGRTYAQGYHVNTQGSAYKKTICDFYEKEVVEGAF